MKNQTSKRIRLIKNMNKAIIEFGTAITKKQEDRARAKIHATARILWKNMAL